LIVSPKARSGSSGIYFRHFLRCSFNIAAMLAGLQMFPQPLVDLDAFERQSFAELFEIHRIEETGAVKQVLFLCH
jgi:hypothetical protein